MIKLNPNILERNGEKVFVVLPYEEFILIQDELDDYDDIKKLRAAKAKEANAETIPLAQAKKEFGI